MRVPRSLELRSQGGPGSQEEAHGVWVLLVGKALRDLGFRWCW